MHTVIEDSEKPRSRERLYEQIHQARQTDPTVSGRELARRYGVSRKTAAMALASPVPPKRKKLPPRTSVLEPVKRFIDAMLRDDVRMPPWQRHTVDRVIRRLETEHGFTRASYSTVRDYVRHRRLQIEQKADDRRRRGVTR